MHRIVPNALTLNKFGSVTISTTAWAPVCQGANLFLPSTPFKCRVKAGGNANDAAGGSGAVAVTFQGVGTDGTLLSETVATAGASASANTTADFLRVFRITANGGTYRTGVPFANNAAEMIFETTGATEIARIPAGYGQSQMCAYTVPTGYYLNIANINLTMQSSGARIIEFRLLARTNTLASGVFSSPDGMRVKRYWRAEDNSGGITEDFGAGLRYPEHTDVWVSSNLQSGSSAIVTAAFSADLRPMAGFEGGT